MKNRFTILFALLCASVMAFATAENTWLEGNPTYANQFKWFSIPGVTPPMEVVNIQSKDAQDVIYVNVGQADFDRTTGIIGCEAITDAGAGVWIKISSLTLKNNEIYFKNTGGTILRGLYIYNDKGEDTSGLIASDLTLTSNTDVTLDPQETSTITYTTSSTGAITFNSSNPNIATVDASGEITAVSYGNAIITVSQAADATYSAGAFSVNVSVNMAKQASGMGFGTLHIEDVDLYDWDGNFAGNNACGKVDLYVLTWGNNILYKAIAKEGKIFDPAQYYFCQLRTWKTDLTDIAEHWARTHSADNTIRYMEADQSENAPGLAKYGDEIKLTSYMVLSGCGARTMKTVSYTRDYINNINVADVTAPVLGAATVTPGADDVTISFAEVTSEPVFYMIEDAEHNKKYFSMVPSFVLPKDGSGITYNYSCYAIDFNGNKSAAQSAEVTMPFSVLTNLALNKQSYSATIAGAEYVTSNAVDGKTNTRWSPGGVANAEDAWWAIDLGAIYNLTSLEMVWEGAYSDNFVIYGADEKPAAWNNVSEYGTTLVTNTVMPNVGNDKNNVYSVSGHARYLLFVPSHLANNGWGASFYEFRAFGTGVYDPSAAIDIEKPVISAATLTSKTYNTAVIALTATDNVGIIKVKAVDTTNGIDEDLVPSDGSITLIGLSGQTAYTITLTAYDAANNVSDAFVMDEFTTDVDPTIPQVAAPTPDGSSKEIRPIYSDAFASILAHPFDKDGWGGVPLMEEKNISGDNCLIYNVASANEVIWGMYDNGNNAIIAADGYHSADGKGVDASAMTHLHIDMWSLQPCTNAINICINDAALKTLRLSHGGSGWQSYDIALSDFQEGDAGKQIDNVRWMKFNGIGPISGKMALDNVYFWAPASGMKSVSASSNNATMGSAVVKQGDDEVTSVAENSEVSFIATANPGYVFVNWTNLGVEVSTEATYVTTITETTNLVANFDYVRTTYCHSEVLTDNDKTLYLSVSKVADNTYKIRIDGSVEARINGRNNFNFVINHTTNYSNAAYDEATGLGWKVSNEGNGYIENTFSAPDYKALTFGSHYFAISAQGGGEFVLDNNFPAANTIAWNSTCSDTEAPVFAKAEAEVLSATSVRLKIKATDNWGGLLTYTIAREAAEPIISNHASGEEFTQDVTGLTAGTEYDFTVTVSDGVNNANTHILVTPVADNTKPYNVDASLVSKTWNAAVISVAADDDFDAEITKFRVVNTTPAIDHVYVASEGKITVTDLVANTDYNFTITALDAADNESELGASVAFKTLLDAPDAACANPTLPADQVKAVYSPTYSADCNFGYWESGTAYTQEAYGKKFVTAGSGYFGLEFINHLSCANMEKLHLDIWIAENASIGIVPIWGGGDVRAYAELTGQQWNSVDLDLYTDYAGVTDWSDVYQLKIDNAANLTFWIANVYFYRTTPYVDNVPPTAFTASLAEESYFSVKINAQASDNSGAVVFTVKNGEDVVATQNAASAAATVINVTGLNAGTAYNLNVYVADEADNTIDPIAINATTKALPSAAPEPTQPAVAVKSIYSEAYTPAIPTGINFNETWWQAPTIAQEVSLGGNNARYYGGLNTNGVFGITWSGDHKLDAAGYQKVHFHIYPTNSATIEIYPVIQPEGEFHKVSQELVGGQWNEVVLDYSEKTFAPFNQFGVVYTAALGDFFIDNLYFYSDPDYTRTVSGNYGTICLPKAGVLANGTLFEIAYYGETSKKIFFDELLSNEMVAGRPYLFKPNENETELQVYYTDNEDPVAAGNYKGLHGFYDLTDEDATFDIPEDAGNYIMYNNQYWLVSGRAAYIENYRAYIVLDDITTTEPDKAPGIRRVSLNVNGEQTITGCEQINASETPVKVMIDGQLYILRGEKMYNANGQIVK